MFGKKLNVRLVLIVVLLTAYIFLIEDINYYVNSLSKSKNPHALKDYLTCLNQPSKQDSLPKLNGIFHLFIKSLWLSANINFEVFIKVHVSLNVKSNEGKTIKSILH